mmetsp:Transcript_2537/g.10628  ORF Transcript_2537/g.10628 Transcript_2537/m.10628 type:complete len:267 (-) Transcript_2537:32-832(-)|eukprot:scaffold368_cov258-Pinguiococcus_pyrenoidosus.AAC.64
MHLVVLEGSRVRGTDEGCLCKGELADAVHGLVSNVHPALGPVGLEPGLAKAIEWSPLRAGGALSSAMHPAPEDVEQPEDRLGHHSGSSVPAVAPGSLEDADHLPANHANLKADLVFVEHPDVQDEVREQEKGDVWAVPHNACAGTEDLLEWPTDTSNEVPAPKANPPLEGEPVLVEGRLLRDSIDELILRGPVGRHRLEDPAIDQDFGQLIGHLCRVWTGDVASLMLLPFCGSLFGPPSRGLGRRVERAPQALQKALDCNAKSILL